MHCETVEMGKKKSVTLENVAKNRFKADGTDAKDILYRLESERLANSASKKYISAKERTLSLNRPESSLRCKHVKIID